MDRVKLIIKDIPQLGIDDIKYIEGRIIEDGLFFPILVKTSNPFKTTYDNNKEVRIVQSRVYEKKIISAYVDESIDMSILELSDNISISYDLEDGNSQSKDIKIISVEAGELSQTKGNKYTISYYEKEIDQISIGNYLSSDYLKDRLDKLEISNLVTINIKPKSISKTEYLSIINGNSLQFELTEDLQLLNEGDTVSISYLDNYEEDFYPSRGAVVTRKLGYLEVQLQGIVGKELTGEFNLKKEADSNNPFELKFYTALIPEVDNNSSNASTTSSDGSTYYLNKLNYNELNVQAYLSLEQKNLWRKYYDNSNIEIEENSSVYRQSANLLPELAIDDNGLIDLYKCNLNIKFAKDVI